MKEIQDALCIGCHFVDRCPSVAAIGFSVCQRGFFDISDRVHPEASDSLVQPEVCHVVKSLPHLGVLPVEVRLLAEECVKIILTACL